MTLRDQLQRAIDGTTQEGPAELAEELAAVVGEWLRERGAEALACEAEGVGFV